MLIARNKAGELVAALKAKKQEEYHCPVCQKPVCLKQGQKQRTHFAHQREHCCKIVTEGETNEHIAGKNWLHQRLENSQLEVYLPQLKQRPDLLVNKTTVEFQCSVLDLSRLKARTKNYQSFHYQPWWIVGQRFIPQQQLSQLQKAFCYWQQTAYLWHLDTAAKQLRLYYLANWDFNRGYQWQCQNVAENTNLTSYTSHVSSLTSNKFYWRNAAYKRFLRQRLFQRQPRFLRLQHFFYQRYSHILDLPFWCYSSSRYHFFFEHELLLLRFLYLRNNNCQQWIKDLSQLKWQWDFPLVSQKIILKEIYLECQRLSGREKESFLPPKKGSCDSIESNRRG
ncbi:competence protein CoiA [Enterococcus sp. SMC-9]|uniref:competence protein CoiA n=1 Tax=Enterococcus sp. SMC-9 TaxID=2862343 RepID=UPI001E5E8B2E|nr:competence protein CoiA family protein [Enterococcus sp. SMC-9]MCD1024189.1 hypothetical protein [Enterococcus sp. SMC-9]